MPKGRPALAGVAKSRRLEVRLTVEEMAKIYRRCNELGKAVSTHARDLLLADADLTAVTKKPAKKK